VAEELQHALSFDVAALGRVADKALSAAKAAEAARRAREVVRRQSTLLNTSAQLPGKLSDCSVGVKAHEREIFIVEGDSAGGSAKQARDRKFQAILPLRGKILNIERANDAAVYKNIEISNIIKALGLGLKGADFDPSSMRYGKVIILTDADVDGAHIRTLLLTFLFRYQRSLFEHGLVYVGVPPLYKLKAKKKDTFCYDDDDLQEKLKSLSKSDNYSIQRFKGLGEMMPDQLWDTTMNPSTRKLRQLTVNDFEAANAMFELLMSGDVLPRRRYIEQEAAALRDIDV